MKVISFEEFRLLSNGKIFSNYEYGVACGLFEKLGCVFMDNNCISFYRSLLGKRDSSIYVENKCISFTDLLDIRTDEIYKIINIDVKDRFVIYNDEELDIIKKSIYEI